MILYIFAVIFSIALQNQLTNGLSKDDKIVVTDSTVHALYVAPMSRDPDLSSAAIIFDPPLGVLLGDVGGYGPDRVRWDGIEQKLYFTMPSAHTVVKSNLDGTDAQVIIDLDNTHNHPLALALDEDTKQIYWSTYEKDLVCTNYDGITTNLDIKLPEDAVNIALDKKHGVLYFTDNHFVGRVNLDGTGLTKIALRIEEDDKDTPAGLVLDQTENKLLWSDENFNQLHSAIQVLDTPDGQNRTILRSVFYDADIYDMVLYYNNLYMVASQTGQLLRMPKDGSSPPVFVGPIVNTELLESPYGITVVFSPPCVTDTLELTATSTSEVSVTWTPEPSQPNQCDADQYQVSYQPYDPVSCSVAADEPGTLPWQSSSTAIVSNLAKNIYYQITISSRNWPADGQNAALGNFVNTVEPCLADLVIEKLPTNQLQLRWSATRCDCKASDYRVAYLATDYCDVKTSRTMFWQTQLEAILPIQGPYRMVEVSVTPRKNTGQLIVMGRPLSTSLDGITAISTGAPRDVTPSDVATDSVTFSWEDLACNDLGGETLRYSYELTSRFGIVSDETSLKAVTFMNLRCGTEYTFRVAAVNVDGTGPLSEGITVDTLISEGSSGPPKDVTPSDVATDSVTFSWEYLACNDLGGETLRYSYELTSSFGIISDETSLKTVTFMNLGCGTAYTFRVAAITADGTGPFSDGITVETLISEEPFTSELSSTSTPSQAEISWSPSECPPSSFDLEYTLILRDQCEAPSVLTPTSLGSVTGSPANLNNLLPFTTYIVSIIGTGSSGVLVKKSVVLITKESVPSAQPVNVELTEAKPTSLTFTWQSLPCTTRNGEVTYQYQLLQQSNVIVSQHTSDNSVVLSSLVINTEYELRVAALTSAGMGLYSSLIPARTLERCGSDYCLNAGLCLFDEATEALSCSCVNGYVGTRCEMSAASNVVSPIPRPATAQPNTQTEDILGPGIISAMSLSAAAVVIATISSIGVFYYVVRARRVSAGNKPVDTSQFSMRYVYPRAGELGNYGMY